MGVLMILINHAQKSARTILTNSLLMPTVTTNNAVITTITDSSINLTVS